MTRKPSRRPLAEKWLARMEAVDPNAPEDETVARELAGLFTDYLKACRHDDTALSMLPPGRFLMPGDLAGSPALTFAPLATDDTPPSGSLGRMMARRYEAYKSVVVKPFFREHFARLDRQIVLIDALHALNAGPEAVADLASAISDILGSFRPGRNSWLSAILTRRIDRILIAATKADHLHHADHDRLEAILGHLLAPSVDRATAAGALVEIAALASVRATREGVVVERGERLPSIIGTPMTDERVNGERFDGKTEIALFPGDLPDDPESVLEAVESISEASAQSKKPAPILDRPLRFVRFRPPKLERTAEGMTLSLPHIRLDRALQFLIGDRLA